MKIYYAVDCTCMINLIVSHKMSPSPSQQQLYARQKIKIINRCRYDVKMCLNFLCVKLLPSRSGWRGLSDVCMWFFIPCRDASKKHCRPEASRPIVFPFIDNVCLYLVSMGAWPAQSGEIMEITHPLPTLNSMVSHTVGGQKKKNRIFQKLHSVHCTYKWLAGKTKQYAMHWLSYKLINKACYLNGCLWKK